MTNTQSSPRLQEATQESRSEFPQNRIMQGDCNDLLPTLPAESVDLILTDPPYLCRYKDRDGRTIANDDERGNVLGAFRELYRVLKRDSFCISFYGWQKVDKFFAAWKDAGFYPVAHLVWPKGYASSTRYMRSCHEQAFLLAKGRPPIPAKPLDDVGKWRYSGNTVHPTEKDVSVLAPLIDCFSTRGGVVLDPFAGSGSTLVAAALCDRRYLGIELEAKYCALAEKRLAGVRNNAKRPAA